MVESPVWLITGVSSGIGLSTVHEVIATGGRVSAVTRKASSVSALRAQYPLDKLLIVEYDVGNAAADADALVDQTAAHFGGLDVVVNNAGYAIDGVVESVSEKDARAQLEVNFWGAAHICRAAVRYFREHNTSTDGVAPGSRVRGGRIINVSSVGGFQGGPTLAYYSASKFALEGFSESLHKELDPSWNIKLIVVQPGGVRTKWANDNKAVIPLPPAYANPNGLPAQFRSMCDNQTPMGDPDKVGRALIAIANAPNPPLRLPLGADARYVIHGKIKEIAKEFGEWKELGVSIVVDGADMSFFDTLDANVMPDNEFRKAAKQ